MKQIHIIVNTRFSATHHWPECPIGEVSFLRNLHRHEFHVTAKKEVFHDDRQIEFIQLKNQLEKYIDKKFKNVNLGRTSCESIARELMDVFSLCYVEVLEDGENGASITKI